jgi:hypothetical protein
MEFEGAEGPAQAAIAEEELVPLLNFGKIKILAKWEIKEDIADILADLRKFSRLRKLSPNKSYAVNSFQAASGNLAFWKVVRNLESAKKHEEGKSCFCSSEFENDQELQKFINDRHDDISIQLFNALYPGVKRSNPTPDEERYYEWLRTTKPARDEVRKEKHEERMRKAKEIKEAAKAESRAKREQCWRRGEEARLDWFQDETFSEKIHTPRPKSQRFFPLKNIGIQRDDAVAQAADMAACAPRLKTVKRTVNRYYPLKNEETQAGRRGSRADFSDRTHDRAVLRGAVPAGSAGILSPLATGPLRSLSASGRSASAPRV